MSTKRTAPGFAESVRRAIANENDAWEVHYYCDAGFPPQRLATYTHSRHVVHGPEFRESILCTMQMQGYIRRA